MEQAISVLGLLSPDFIELEGHVFWLPDVKPFDPQKFHLKGLVEAEVGILKKVYRVEMLNDTKIFFQ
ncbi:hypothetical protein PSCICN_06320 [Pseudomonas cichorii]|uniref:hypothetical protein n=1 Tax=Pseudomonas cichorii TaxID=36746 RepID=UPI001A07B907|nr:hypothetical protein [Pseudomonas cichorii]GFM79940.1 hypothetical protein PSCICN_06320 [Pseudomonas cichorii]